MASIYNAQDIQIPDINDRIDYYRKFVSGDIEGAKDIYESNPNLVGKCVNAEMFNQLLNEIISLETDYKSNVTDFLEAQYDKYQININHFVYMQEYDDATQYEVNNLVTLGEDIYFVMLDRQ